MQADYIEIARGITECLERNKDKIFFRDANCEEIATQFAAYEDHWEKLSGIKAISLEGLSLTALPEAIKHLPALKTLEIWKCGIQELPPWIGDIPGLHLCFYDLTNEWAVSLFGNFDEPWFKTAKIAGLSFQGKNLTEISERVRNLPLLQTVSLQGSSLTKLPDWIWDIATLKKLKLYDCSKIKELPQGITRCSSLETIEIRSCSIEKIPDDIGSLKSLKNLTIDNYETSYIPPSFANLHSLETLKLAFHANNMSELPDFIGDLTSLIRLRLRIVDGEGKFRTLPATIGNLKALKGLAIFYWQYHGEDEDEVTFSLPETIGELESLVDLYLCGANIKKLPESIGKLTQLRLLDLNGSGLLSLPASIGNLSSLVVLVLANTEITEFGESIGNLKNLQGLYAKETKITRLPRSFKELTALEELDLKNTSISNEYAEEIAHCLYSMPNLKIFRYSICSPGGLDEELPGRYNTFTDPEEYIYG